MTAAASPLGFELVDGGGQVLYRGQTRPRPRDPSSGDGIEEIDFSAYRNPGRKLHLRVPAAGPAAVSDPFDIDGRADLAPLSRAALRDFYLNRSGIPLEARVTEGPWARAAGHPTDAAVPCAPDPGCTYALDVSGGWYDAGDYGKYVVNGGPASGF